MKSKKQMMRERDAALKEKVKFTQTLAYLIVQANGRLVLNKDNVVPLDGYRIHVEENDQELILRLMDDDHTFLGEGSPSTNIPVSPEAESLYQEMLEKDKVVGGTLSPSPKESDYDPMG